MKDIFSGASSSFMSSSSSYYNSYDFELVNVGGTLYFTGDNGINGTELWKSNGTAAGTVLVKDFEPGSASSYPGSLTMVNNLLFMAMTKNEIGNELFVLNLTNGTAGNDSFVVTYSGTSPNATATVTLSSNGGPMTTLGVFPANFPLPLNGLGGTDSVRIVGTGGNDIFTANASGLTVNGARLVFTSIEARTIVGGAGNDSYQFDTDASLGTFTLNEAGGGVDTLDFSTTTTKTVSVNLSTASVQTVNSGLSLILSAGITVENVIGGSLGDTLIGNARPNTLIGNAGNDILVGLDGNDRLEGGTGLDVMIGGNGLDTLLGGDGDDILIAGRTSNDLNAANLNTIRTAWTASGVVYSTRVTNLRTGVGAPMVSLKKNVNVLNDAGEDDSLNGGTGTDWYFRAIDDVISDLVSGELVDLL